MQRGRKLKREKNKTKNWWAN